SENTVSGGNECGRPLSSPRRTLRGSGRCCTSPRWVMSSARARVCMGKITKPSVARTHAQRARRLWYISIRISFRGEQSESGGSEPGIGRIWAFRIMEGIARDRRQIAAHQDERGKTVLWREKREIKGGVDLSIPLLRGRNGGSIEVHDCSGVRLKT